MIKMTCDEYIERLSSIEPNITVLGEYNGANSPIHVKCDLCGHEWFPRASSLTNGKTKCPKCHSRPPIHDDKRFFANAYPEFAKYLLNKCDGYKYMKMSSKKVDWICPYCGSIVKGIPINKITTRKHIPCKICSDGISYPNKVMYNLLTQLNENFITEYSPAWIAPKRYDFFIPSKKIIIEMDGAIGHGGKTYNGDDGKHLEDIDKYKDYMAIHNGIDIIRIDSIKSDIKYISNNIIKSKLSLIYDLSLIDWELCDKYSFSSLQMETCKLWKQTHDMQSVMKELKLSRFTVVKYLNKLARHGLCDYKPKEQQVISGKKNISKAYNKNKKSVICLNTLDVFQSCREAYKWLGYNIDGHSIQDNCKGLTKSAGRHPITKERLSWMFINDYKEKKVIA